MRDTTDTTIELNLAPKAKCAVSYTLNNYQPVRSTFIGDEPLFFMDYEPAIEEELDEHSLDFLEKSLFHMEQLMEEERVSFSARQEKEDIGQLFAENASSITKSCDAKHANFTLDDLIQTISKSRMAEEFLNFAEANGIDIQYSQHVRTAYYDRDMGIILMHPYLPEADKINLLSMELRRVWQHKNGTLIDPLFFYPDQAILVNRAQAADIATIMIRIAWELQLSGYDTAWMRLEESSMNDLTHAMAREATLDFRSLNDGSAQGAVFETWFMSDRCCKFDKMIIQNMLSDHNGLVFGENMNASMALTADLIAKLGTMPYGKNYLSGYTTMIMNDPVFSEIRDRANANFLWFIKFERSFRESERDLQNSSTQNIGTAQNAVQTDETLVGEEPNEENRIIQLPVAFKHTEDKNEQSGSTANIIEFMARF